MVFYTFNFFCKFSSGIQLISIYVIESDFSSFYKYSFKLKLTDCEQGNNRKGL